MGNEIAQNELDPADAYVAPASNLATAIQYPLDSRWTNRVINAHRTDGRALRAKQGVR
jgi:hypothetical protein